MCLRQNNMNKFLKIFFSTFLFFVLFTKIIYAEVVNKVEVVGNKRISIETIVIFGDIAIGKDYEASDINSLIKKLYETSYFEDISVELSKNILKINVKENPIINSLVFDGEKADKFKDQLVELLSLSENRAYVKSYIKNDINLIKEFYRQFGFYFIKIDAKVDQLEGNRVNVTYLIEKGEKAKIARIYFLGEKKVREKKLRDIITSQENKFWKVISRSVYLSEQRINLDKRLLKNYYRNKGYYEVDIKSSNVEYSEGEGFVLTFNINAGKRYKFKKISANVSESLDKEAFASLEEDFNKLVGNYYSQRDLRLVLEKIDKLSEQKELQFINHGVLENLDDDGVEVKINIFEGDKVLIERVNIVGNSVTNDAVIRSSLIVDEGDPFSTLLVKKSINEIKSLNIFGKVEHRVLPGSSDDLKVLEISVEEKATGEIMAGAGLGTDGTSFQFAVSENNWLGRGIKLESSFSVSAEKVSGNVYINNPNYKFSGNAVNTNIDVSSTDKTSTSGFKSSRTGFGLGTTFEQYEDFFIAPDLSVSWEEIKVEDSASSSFKKMKGNFFNADLGYRIISDKRNQSFKPTEGHIIAFKQSLPIVQDSSSILNGVDISKYHSFSDDLIGSLKLHARAINGVDDDVRLTNRLYIPRNRLRGFNTFKVGPKDGDDYIGGNYTTALSFEAQLPNLLPETYKTDVVLFIDAANVWGVDYADSINETNTLRSSFGFNTNVFTTIGPLNFTVAQSITKAANDETETFNFRLGTSF